MSEPYTAIQLPMMPKDTNRHGTIFGGVLLSYIDLAGAIAAQRELQLRGGNPKAAFVTVAINRVEFKRPVLVGDVVRFETYHPRRPHVDHRPHRRSRRARGGDDPRDRGRGRVRRRRSVHPRPQAGAAVPERVTATGRSRPAG